MSGVEDYVKVNDINLNIKFNLKNFDGECKNITIPEFNPFVESPRKKKRKKKRKKCKKKCDEKKMRYSCFLMDCFGNN